MRLSEKVQAVIDRRTITRWDIEEWLMDAQHMEGVIDAFPTTRTGDPATSYYDGTIESMKESEQAVLKVMREYGEPMDSMTLEDEYQERAGYGEVKMLSHSAIRTSRARLVKFHQVREHDQQGTARYSDRDVLRWVTV